MAESHENPGLSDNSQTISMDGIKALVSSHFPPGHPLREVILAEKEDLKPEELAVRMETWSVLLNRVS